MSKYFGTDGIRGAVPKYLNYDIAFYVGEYVGKYYSDKGFKKIILGRDTRESGEMLEKALLDGLLESNIDVFVIGVCSTPCLAYCACSNDIACGIMISASHNPYHDNGIKIFGNDGIKIHDDIELKIEEYIDQNINNKPILKEKIGNIIEYKEGIKKYQDWILSLYNVDLSKFNILIDLASGSNCVMVKDVFKRLNANVTYINDTFDGKNINNGCGSTHLEGLIEKIKKGNYDLGFAFDGDADRVLFVNHDGDVVDGDAVMYILSLYLQKKNQLKDNILVTTVMSNIGLYKALKKHNITSSITQVGDKNVLDEMIRGSYAVGGEQSGHIILLNDSNFGDGLKTSLALLSALVDFNMTIDEAKKELVIFPQLLINQKVKDKNIVLNDVDIKNEIEDIAKELKDDGRILVRPSGTEPLIRVMVEASDNEKCKLYVNRVINLINNKGYSI